MKRKKFLNRENYQLINDELGFDFQVIDHKKYWLEDVGYELTTKEVDLVEKAANDLHQMCFSAIDYIISKNRFKDLNIPEKMIPFIKKSWEREDWSLYGRFDFCFDGKKLKMLEYNADTPTSLVEASLAQWKWMEGQGKDDQFNSIDEKMVAWWEAYKEEFNPGKVYFTTVKENHEDYRNTEYIMDTASRAGLETDFIFIEDLGSDGEYLYDLENNSIEFLFKLYPWEWLANEDQNFLDVILKDNIKIIEPAWKMLLSNKGLLAILWELFPNHEYLLPTYFDPKKLGSTYVKKPLLSREGQNVEIVTNGDVETQQGLYKSEFNVYQQYCELPKFDDVYAVVGAWVVGEEACGMGIREDHSKITANMSCFAPHYMVEESTRQASSKKTSSRTANTDAVYSSMNSKPSRDDDDSRESNSAQTIATALMALVAVGIFGVIMYLIVQNNEKVEEQNKVTSAYNEGQLKILKNMFPSSRASEVSAWINSNVSTQNQPLFREFYNLHKDMVVKGMQSKDEFFKADERLSKILFCIQGEKDVNNLNEFLDKMVFDSNLQKEAIAFLKKKYNYDERKIKVPTEEDVLETCEFKSFESDLKSNNDRFNSQETNPSKKVIVEDAEQ